MVKRYIWMHRKSCLRYCNLDPILHAFFSDNSKTHTYRQRSAVCGVGVESRWRAFLHSWCDAGILCYLFILALAKTVTPLGSPRREPGQAAPPTTKRSSLARKFSRCGAPMTYTDLLGAVYLFKTVWIWSWNLLLG